MADSLSTVSDIRDRIGGVRTAMVTTTDERGTLSSRPVTVQKIDDSGDVWFLVDRKAEWVAPPIGAINVAIVESDDAWVSFAGRAELVEDSATVEDLKDPMSDAFFDEGAVPVALRAVTDRIEWWTAAGKLTQMVQLAKAVVTDGEPDIGDSGTIEV